MITVEFSTVDFFRMDSAAVDSVEVDTIAMDLSMVCHNVPHLSMEAVVFSLVESCIL